MPQLLFKSDLSIRDTKTVYKLSHDLHVGSINPSDCQRFDIVLNIGLAPGRKYYSMETCAHRDGYVKKDIHGETMEGDTFWRDVYNAPPVLQPTLDIPDIWRRWKQALLLPEEDVRPSNNAGRYLCEFIFYTSMLESWRRNPNDERRFMFLHVPSGSDEEDLERGTKVALALIAAMVSSEVTKIQRPNAGGGHEAAQISIMSGGNAC